MFFWCHIRHINPIKIYPGRITLKDIEPTDTLDYSEIELPVSKKVYSKIETKKKISINLFLL